ncbi:hypothetical protein AGDE_15592 [Angomonas deanei]|nr:hypothetical protein AGDE_15592 [Angomonas deanei]|eukprot:EPY18792.1 hypothetical protein AGDE_15592 [Angomonas deanei]
MVPAGPTPPPPGASSSLLSLQTQSNASEGEEEKKEKEEEDKWSFEREHELRFLPPELRGEGGAAPTSADPSPGQEEEEMEDLPEEEGEENETSINNYYEFSKYIFQNIPRATDLPKVKSQRTRRGCRRIRGGNHNSSSHSDPNTTVGGIASDTDLMERMEELLVYKEENRELMRSAERGMERSTSPDHTNPQEELDELKEAFNNSGVRRGRRGMRRAASEHNRPHNEEDNHTTAKEEEEEAAKAADSPPGQPVEGTLSSQSPINHGMDTSAPSPVTLPMEESAPTPPEAGGTSPLEASQEGTEPPAVDNASVTSTATTGSANSLQYYTFCQEEEMTKAKTDETGKKKKSKKRKSSKVESTDVPALGLPTTKSKTSRYVIKHTPRGSTGGRRISAPVVEGKLGNIHYNNKAKEQTEFMATVMQALAERNPTAGGDLHIEGKQLPLARRDTFPKNKRRKTFSSFNTSAAANNNNNNTTVERPRRVTLPPTQTSHPNSPDDTITAESPLISSSFLTVHQNLTERKERYKMMEEIYVNNNNTSNSPVHAAGFTVEATPPGLDSLSPNRNHNNNSNTNLLSPQNEVEAVGSGSLVGINSNPNNTAGASEPTSEGASPANPVYLPPPAVSPSNTRRKVVLQTRVTPKISATPSNNNNKEADATNNSNAGTPTRRRGKEANNNSNSPPAQHVSLQTNNNNNTTTNATSSNNNSNTNSAVRRRASLGEGNILSLPKRQ